MKLVGKVAILTGGSGNIGRFILEELVKEGCDVVFTYLKNRKFSKILELNQKFSKERVYGVKCDVRKYDEIKNVVDFTIENFGKIDILINNAGIGIEKPVEEVTLEEWEEIINVNLRAPFIFTKLAVKHMKNQKSGKIVNISSVGGIYGIKNWSVHGAAKGGLIGFTKNLAVELAEYNINVNCIAPGTIRIGEDEQLSQYNEIINKIPLRRIGHPVNVSKIVVFLCCDDSNYITGETIIVDGGRSVLW
ncbi:MAG: glucose 1-dehydrogenase [Endomicrobia bacterium]|nr:glucose 1-dehydrogenase [Endomicrobiia bacterium]